MEQLYFLRVRDPAGFHLSIDGATKEMCMEWLWQTILRYRDDLTRGLYLDITYMNELG